MADRGFLFCGSGIFRTFSLSLWYISGCTVGRENILNNWHFTDVLKNWKKTPLCSSSLGVCDLAIQAVVENAMDLHVKHQECNSVVESGNPGSRCWQMRCLVRAGSSSAQGFLPVSSFSGRDLGRSLPCKMATTTQTSYTCMSEASSLYTALYHYTEAYDFDIGIRGCTSSCFMTRDNES